MPATPQLHELEAAAERARAATTMVLALLGVALLALPAQRFRTDVLADHCDVWPALPSGFAYGTAYLGALAMFTVVWLRAGTHRLTLRRVLLWGAALNLCVLVVAPPFLSLDTVYYGAFGRAVNRLGRTPEVPVAQFLGGDDSLVRLLPVNWYQLRGSAYGRLFNELSRLIARIGGDSPLAIFRLFQAVAAAAMVAAAWLVGLATTRARGDREAGARAAALVLFCPLTLIEASANGHNDALLALAVAAFVWCVAHGRAIAALLPLGLGVLVKGSGLLPLGLYVIASGLRLSPRRPGASRLLTGFAVAIGLVVALGLQQRALAEQAIRISQTFSGGLIGLPSEPLLHCSRQFECLPRALAYWVLHLDQLAWWLGVLFRAAGALWMLYAATRASEPGATLRWAGLGLFIYFLFFQGYFQSWYLLFLLPLLPFAEPRWSPFIQLFVITSLVYYALRLPLNCALSPAAVGMKELAEGLVVVGIPGVLVVHRVTRSVTR